ncbi:MAG TPA: PTS sugar transporter subunit IIA [Thermoanaerobaculia bacterium]|nr:PTS sugar transporter subunit IIA [Thermoanaerobaculia bacterium]HTQ08632.1 PTS sugar transporter subunit IIA [Fimbriimonadaceae bacterium]
MTVKQMAEYLSLNERTVLKLVTDGALPGVKVGSQWRFRKAMIDAWLDDQMLGVVPRYLDGPAFYGSPRRMLELAACFQPGLILPELTARSKNGVIEELASFAHRLALVRDKTWFVGALIERENILPSAIGNGTAFLHTLRRNAEQVTRPFMVLGRSREGVDFDALDGKPTHLFFVLGLKYDELHLPWLHKLSQMLASEQAVKVLLDAPDAPALYGALFEAERCLEAHSMTRTAQG